MGYKLVIQAYLTALVKALDSKIKLNGAVIPVYTMVPKSVTGYYIYIYEVNADSQGVKDANLTQCKVNIEVVHPFTTNVTSKVPGYNIINQIMEIIFPSIGATLTISGYNMVIHRLDNVIDFVESGEAQDIHRVEMRIVTLIEQL